MPQVALVVDDSMLVRHTVCRFLEERGYEVESATNGAEALQIVGCLRPDLIITDLVMPRMTGPELITALKSNPTTAAIPIVVLAGRRGGKGLQPELRADYVIHKDIDIVAQLQTALAKLFAPSAC
ncbi:MAG: response regulator [Acidobacteriia bacterium]|nr:response regulator [Terriglobia bacterium]